MKNKGRVLQIIGAVVDLQFTEGKVPEIYNAIEVENKAQKTKLVLEVQQHLGSGQVRAVAMSSTDGLRRGDQAIDTGSPISVPVGEAVLGRIFNVLGQPIDENGTVKAKKHLPIHRLAPTLEEQQPTTEIFETGIKVIDLIAPFVKGGII